MTLKEYKDKRMKDPAFIDAYEEVQLEMNAIRSIVDADTSQSTQKESTVQQKL